jgi:hypothetical protein
METFINYFLLWRDTFYKLLFIIGDYMILTPTLKAQSLIGKMMAIGWS